MKQYLDLVKHVLDNGTRKENRTGVDTLSCFNYNYTVDLRGGFPLLTTKKIDFKSIVVEMLWFLSGQTNISILKRHGCRFWDSWADPKTGDVPSAYGAYWTHFPVHERVPIEPGTCRVKPGAEAPTHSTKLGYNDQIKWVIDELKRNPMSRRLIVSAWDPANAQQSKLPPCHLLFAFNVQNETREELTHFDPYSIDEGGEMVTRKRLCLHLTQRSGDIALGIPFNIASYALLLHLFSRFTGIEPGDFGHSIIDAHIYTSKADGSMAEYDHVPGLREQLTREPRKLPRLVIDRSIKTLEDIEALMEPSVTTEHIMSLFRLEGYDPHPALKFKVAV